MIHPKDDPRYSDIYALLANPTTNDRKRAFAKFSAALLELRHTMLETVLEGAPFLVALFMGCFVIAALGWLGLL